MCTSFFPQHLLFYGHVQNTRACGPRQHIYFEETKVCCNNKIVWVQEWNVIPRPLWAVTEWGGHNLATLSNVVFSNGLYDPWHGGGVLEDLSDSVKVCCAALVATANELRSVLYSSWTRS